MKYKKARSRSEVQQMAKHLLEGDFENYTAELQASQVAEYCDKLAKRGLLIEQWDLDDLEADLEWCGMSGSPTKVHRIQSVVLAGGEYKEFPATDEGIATMVGELVSEHTIG
jgi:electron transfer flavoprotein beta subunit